MYQRVQAALLVVCMLVSFFSGVAPAAALMEEDTPPLVPGGEVLAAEQLSPRPQWVIEPAFAAALREWVRQQPLPAAIESRADLILPIVQSVQPDFDVQLPLSASRSVPLKGAAPTGPELSLPGTRQISSLAARPLSASDNDLILSVAGPANVNNYEPISYVITLQNVQDVTKTASVTHTVPERWEYLSVEPAGRYTSTGTLEDPWVVTLSPESAERITVTYQTWCNASSGQFSAYFRQDGYDDEVRRTYSSVHNGDITLTKLPGTQPANVGDLVTWRVTVRSTGFGPVRYVTVTDILSDGLAFVSADFTGSGAIYSGTHTGGFDAYAYYDYIPVGENRTYTVTAMVIACEHVVNEVDAWWGIEGHNCDPQMAKASVVLNVHLPKVSFSVSPNPVRAAYCEPTPVTVTVRNAPGVGIAYSTTLMMEVPEYTLSDLRVDGTPVVSVHSGDYYTVTVGDLEQSQTSVVTFLLEPEAGYCAISAASLVFDVFEYNECGILVEPPLPQAVSLAVAERPTLHVSKTAPSTVRLGQNIDYALVVSYSGPVDMRGDVTITDVVPTDLTPQGIYPAGGIWNPANRTIVWSVPATDVTSGTFFVGGFYLTLPVTDETCSYCNRTFVNRAEAALMDTCGCNVGAQSSPALATTAVGCDSEFAGERWATPRVQETCRLITYTNAYTFGAATSEWDDLTFREQVAGGQVIPEGAMVDFTVITSTGSCRISQSMPISATFSSLEFLAACGAGPAYTSLHVQYALEPVVSNDWFYDYSYLTVPHGEGAHCGGGEGTIALPVWLSADESAMDIALSHDRIIEQCEVISITIDLNKESRPGVNIYTPTVVFNDHSHWTVDLSSVEWHDVPAPAHTIAVGSRITWTWGAGEVFTQSGSVTFQARKTSGCAEPPDMRADLYYHTYCGSERSSYDTGSSTFFLKGRLESNKRPEIYYSTDGTATFRLQYANLGEGALYNLVIADTLGSGLIYDPSTTGPAEPLPSEVSPDRRVLTWTLPYVPTDTSQWITTPVAVDTCSGDLHNVMVADWGCGDGTQCQLPQRHEARVEVPPSNFLVRNFADIRLCQINTVTLQLRNSGATYLFDELVTQTLPTAMGLFYSKTVSIDRIRNGVRTAGIGDYEPGIVPTSGGTQYVWDMDTLTDTHGVLGDMAPEDIVELVYQVRTSCDADGTAQASALARYRTPCQTLVTTPIYLGAFDLNKPRIRVVKSPAISFQGVGEPITWTVDIQNVGEALAPEVMFWDDYPETVDTSSTVLTATSAFSGTGAAMDPWIIHDLRINETRRFTIANTVVDSCSFRPVSNTIEAWAGCNGDVCVAPTQDSSPLAVLQTNPDFDVDLEPDVLDVCGGMITVTLWNDGAPAGPVTLTDTLPASYVYYGHTVTGTLPTTVSQVVTNVVRFDWNEARIDDYPHGGVTTITLQVRNLAPSDTCSVRPDESNEVEVTFWDSCQTYLHSLSHDQPVEIHEPALAISKTPPRYVVERGGLISWTISAENLISATAPAHNVVVRDVPGAGYSGITTGVGSRGEIAIVDGNTVTWTINGDVEPGEEWSAWIAAHATVGAGLDNEVTATAHCGSGCVYAVSDSANASAAEGITKTVASTTNDDSTTVRIGDIVTYELYLNLWGGYKYSDVVITDALPAGLGYVTSTCLVRGSSGTETVAPIVSPQPGRWGNIIWNVDDTPDDPGQSGVLTGPKAISITLAAQVTDTAAVRTNDVVATWRDQGLPYQVTDAASITVTEPSLDIAKDVRTSTGGNGSQVAEDGWVTYTLAITNSGTAAAYDVAITDRLPVGLELAEVPTVVAVSDPSGALVTDTNGLGATELRWEIAQLNVGGTIAITYVTRLNGHADAHTTLTNTAWIREYSSLPGAVSGEREYPAVGPRETVVRLADGAIGKAEVSGSPSADGYAVPGETITYTLRYTVPAGVALNEAAVWDMLPMESGVLAAAYVAGSAVGPLPIGAAPPVTAVEPVVSGNTLQWVLGTVANATTQAYVYELAFGAQVTSALQVADGDVLLNLTMLDWAGGSASASVPVTVTEPSLDIAKDVRTSTGGNGSQVAADGWVTYTLAIANDGTSAAYDVAITDRLPVGLELAEAPTVVAVSDPSGTVVTDTNALSATALVWDVTQLNVGGTIAITYVTRLTGWAGAGSWLTNTAWIREYSSLPGVVAGERKYSSVGPRRTTVGTTPVHVLKLEQSGSPSADGEATIGETITYTLRYTVPAGVAAYTPVLVDRLPHDIMVLDVSYVSGSSAGPVAVGGSPAVNVVTPEVAADGRTVTWTLQAITNPTTLDYGYYITFQVKVRDVAAIAADEVTVNDTSFTWHDGVMSHTVADSEPITIVEPDIAIGKAASASTVRAGQLVTFTITIDNAAPSARSPLFDAVVTDTLCFFMDYVGVGPGTPDPATVGGGWPNDTIITWAPSITNTGLQTVGVDQSLVYELIARVRDNVSSAMLITNHVEILGSSMPGAVSGERRDPSDPRYDEEDLVVLGTRPGTYHKSAEPDLVTIGEVITYSLHFTVPARTSFYAPVVTDVLPDGLTYNGTAGIIPAATIAAETVYPDTPTTGVTTVQWDLDDVANATDVDAPYALVFTATVDQEYESTGDDMARGDVLTNRYRIDWGRLPDGSERTDHPYVTNTVEVVEPRLAIVKQVETSTGGNGSLVGSNGLVTYTLTITNDDLAATSAAYDVAITDALPMGLELAEVPTVVAVSDPSGALVTDTNGLGATALAWEIAQLNVGGTIAITYVTRLNGHADAHTTLTNTAWIREYSSLPGAVSGEREYPAVGPRETVVRLADGAIGKAEVSGSPSADGYAVPGETITYTLRYTVPAGTALNEAAVWDMLPMESGVLAATYVARSSVGPVPVGATLPVTAAEPVVSGNTLQWVLGTVANPTTQPYVYELVFRAQVTSALPVGDGDVLLNLTMLDWAGGSASASVAVTVTEPSLDIAKAVRTSTGGNGSLVAADGWVTYTLAIANSGTAAAYDVAITDRLPVGLELAEAPTVVAVSDPSGTVVTDTNVLSATALVWDVTQLNVGGTIAITYVTRLTGWAGAGAWLTNTAWIREYGSLPGVVAGEREYPAVGPRRTTVGTTPASLVKLEQSGSPSADGEATIGETITYTLRYTVPAGVAAYTPVLVDRLPHDITVLDVSYVSGSSAGPVAVGGSPAVNVVTPEVAADGRMVTWTLQTITNPTTLDYGYYITFQVKVRDVAAIAADEVTVNDTSFTWHDGVMSHTVADSEPITIVEPDIAIGKAASATLVRGADVVTFTITIDNAAPSARSPLFDAVVTDTMCMFDYAGVGAGTPLPTSVDDSGCTTVVWRPSVTNTALYTIDVNHTIVYELVGRVKNPIASNWVITNQVEILGSSMPGSVSGERRDIANSRYSESDAVDMSTPLDSYAKTSPSVATIGEVITYSLSFTVPAHTVLYKPILTDVLPDGLTYVDWGPIDPAATYLSGGSDHNPATGETTVNWRFDDISNSASVPVAYALSFRARVDQTYESTGDDVVARGDVLTNRYRIDWGRLPDGSERTDHPYVTSTVEVVEPRLEIVKQVETSRGGNGSLVGSNGLVTYTLTITNDDLAVTSAAYAVVVTDALPVGLELAEVPTVVAVSDPSGALVTDTNGLGATELRWEIAQLNRDGTISIRYVTRLNGLATPHDVLTNTAWISAYSSLPGEAGSEREYPAVGPRETVVLLQRTGELAKAEASGAPSADGYAVPGETITYTLRYTVPAGTAAYGVVLTDRLPHDVMELDVSYVSGSSVGPVAVGATPPVGTVTPEVLGGGRELRWVLGTIANETLLPYVYELAYRGQVTNAAALLNGDVTTNRSGLSWNEHGITRTVEAAALVEILEPSLDIAKDVRTSTGGNGSLVAADGRVTYTLAITNSGMSAAYNVAITDALPVGLELAAVPTIMAVSDPSGTVVTDTNVLSATALVWDVAQLNVGGTIAITYVTRLNGLARASVLTNTAWIREYSSLPGVVGGERVYSPVGPRETHVRLPGPSFSKSETSAWPTADGYAAPGETITYTLSYTVPAGTAAHYVVIKDRLPSSITTLDASYVPGSSLGPVAGPGTLPVAPVTPAVLDGGSALRWDLGSVSNPTAIQYVYSISFRAQLTTAAAVVAGRTTVNDAELSWNDGGVERVLTDTVPIEIIEPAMTMSKDVRTSNGADGSQVAADGWVTYTLVIPNNGAAAAYDIVVSDVLPVGLQLAVTPSDVMVSAPTSAVVTDMNPIGADALEWTVSQLNAGETITISYVTRMDGWAGAGSWLTNTARLNEYSSVAGDVPPKRIYGPGEPQSTSVGTPLAGVAKTESSGNPSPDGEAAVGETVTYTLRYTVPAGTAAYSPILVDELPADITNLDLTFESSSGPTAQPPAPAVAAVTPVVAPDGKTVTWTLQTIANPTTLDYVYTIALRAKVGDDPAIDAGDVTVNHVTFLWSDGSVTHADRSEEPITIVEPDVAIDKASSESRLQAGELVTFTITIDNLAPSATSPLFDVVVTDTACAFMDFYGVGPGTPSPDAISGGGSDCLEVVWHPSVTNTGLYRIDVDDTLIYELVARVSDRIGSGQTVRNAVEVLCSSVPGAISGERRDPGNPRYDDRDEVTMDTATGSYDKQGVPVTATIGQAITYSLQFTVPAHTTFYSPILTDVLPDGLTYRGTAGLVPSSPYGPVTVQDDTPLAGETTIQWLVDDVSNPSAVDVMHQLVFTATVDRTYANGDRVQRGDTFDNHYVMDWGRLPDGSERTHNPFVTETVEVVEPRLTIAKSVDRTVVQPGDAVTYTVAIHNRGNSTAYDVPLTDTLPSGIAFGGIVEPVGANPDDTRNPIVWDNVGPIEPDATLTYIYTATIDPGVPDNAVLTNGVTTTYSSLPGPVPGKRYYPPESDDSTVTVLAPNLLLTKTLLSERHPQAGEEVTWQVDVLNDGSGTVLQLVVTDTLPEGFAYVAGSTSASWAGGFFTEDPAGEPGPDLQWNTGARLDPGDALRLTFCSHVGAGVLAGVYTNVAAANGVDIGGGRRLSNLDDDYVIVTRPGVEVAKALVVPGNGVAVLGEQVTFTLRVTNTGTTSLTQIVLTDTFDSGFLSFAGAQPAPSSTAADAVSWIFSPHPPLEPDEFISMDVTFDTLTVTQSTTDTVRADATDFNGDPVPGDEDSEPVRITRPSYVLAKTLVQPANGIAVVSEVVRFNVLVTNTGDTALTSVPMVDSYDTAHLYYDWANPPSNDNVDDGQVDWTNVAVAAPGGRILPGESLAVSVYFTAVMATPLDTINFVTTTNVVDEFGDPIADVSDSEPVRITDPRFVIQKTLVGSSPVGVTDIITFDVWITNSGTTTLAVIPLVDTFEPQYLSYRWASPVNPDSVAADGTLTWNDLTDTFGDLAPSTGLKLSAAFYVEYQPDHNRTTNVATVTGAMDVNGDVLPEQSDSETVEVLTPGLHLVKRADIARSPAEVGDPITYTLCISNDGSTSAIGVVLTDMIPANTSFAPGSATSFEPSIPGEAIQYYDGGSWGEAEPGSVRGVRWLVPVLLSDTVSHCTRFQVTINHTWTVALAETVRGRGGVRVSGLAAPLLQEAATEEPEEPTSTPEVSAPTAEPAPPTEEPVLPTEEPATMTPVSPPPTEEPLTPTQEPAEPTATQPGATATPTAEPRVTATVMPTSTLPVSPTATLAPSATPDTAELIAAPLVAGQAYRLLARDGSLTVDIPAGAVAQDGELLVEYVASDSTAWPATLTSVGRGTYEFSGVTEFLEPVLVSVYYGQSEATEVSNTRLALYAALGDVWVPLPSRLDETVMSVSTETDRLGMLALLGEAPAITATLTLTTTATPTSTIEITGTPTITATPTVTLTPTVTPTVHKSVVTLWSSEIHNEAQLSGVDIPQRAGSATVAVETADPAISKRADKKYAYQGDRVTFTIVANNPGPSTATDVVVSDELEKYFVIETASSSRGDCEIDLRTRLVTATVGTLLPDQSATIVIVAVVNKNVKPPMTVHNQAILDFDQSPVKIRTPQISIRILEEPSSIPEPSTLVMMGSGLMGLAGWAWYRRKQRKH